MLTKLLAGMDVSGDHETGNYKYMSIVITTEEYLNSIFKKSGYIKTHMSSIQNKDPYDTVFSRLNFGNKNIITFCLRIDQKPIMKKFQRKKSSSAKKPARYKFLKSYNCFIWNAVKEHIVDFSVIHHHAIDDLKFECDSDCIRFAKDNSLHHVDKADAHSLADIIAWYNNHGHEPNGVISIDLRNDIEGSFGI